MKVRQMKHRARSMTVCRGTGWGPGHYVRKHCGWPATPTDLRVTAHIAAYEWQRAQDQYEDDHYGEVYEQAYIAACELVGPNDIEFDSVHERLMEEML